MSLVLAFREKKLLRLKISIFTHARFQEIYTVFNEIVFPFNQADRETYTYAVLELVNNSLRAHRERSSSQPVEVTFHAKNPRLEVIIEDRGGGFDPSRLPYDLDQDIGLIDLHGEPFQRYRQVHNNTRFGMGLYIAKRAFSGFSLGFIDERGNKLAWGSPEIVGTRILLTLTGEGL
jgi:anti-sigma regulatory factor (Ser/Thr protein kinase)